MNKPQPFEFDDSDGWFEHAMPLMDVILLILFFFLTTSTYSSHTQEMDLNLPTSAEANSSASKTTRVVLTSQGGIIYDGSPVTEDELNSILEDVPKKNLLLISAESKVKHERVVRIMERARSSGIRELGIEVEGVQSP